MGYLFLDIPIEIRDQFRSRRVRAEEDLKMASVLVDTNILVDLYTEDVNWEDRSAAALASAADRDCQRVRRPTR